jgi:hypothetical protein
MVNPLKSAYEGAMGQINNYNIPNNDDEILSRAYKMSLLQQPNSSGLPLPENIIPQTIEKTKEAYKSGGGIVPAILSGLGGIMNLANTSVGQRLVNQALGGDVYSGSAREENAQKQAQYEMGLKQMAAQEEAARKKAIADYELKKMELDIAAPKRRLEELQTKQIEQSLETQPTKTAAELKKGEAELKEIERRPEKEKQAEFEKKRDAIYQANKDIPGSEAILNAKNEQELNAIRIGKGMKLPLIGKIGGKIETAKPLIIKNKQTGGIKQSIDGGATWKTIK